MGFSAVAATAILLSAGILAGTGVLEEKTGAEAERDRAAAAAAARTLRAQQTAMSVTDFQYVPGQDLVRVDVENAGHVTLHADRLHLLLDGTWVVIDSYTVDAQASDLWPPGALLVFEATWPTEPQDIALVSEDGVQHFWRQ